MSNSSDPPPTCSLGTSGLPAPFLARLSALKGKKIFVTGGVGFLGGHIVSVLLQAGATVKVFDVILPRPDHSAWKLDDKRVEVVKGDLTSYESVSSALAGCWCVIHVASPSPTSRNAVLFQAVNVGGTGNLLRACKELGVQRFVHTSSASVVFDGQHQRNFDESAPKPVAAMDDYTKSKWDAEVLVLNANGKELWTTALRPHGIFGPRDPHFLPVLAETGKKGKSKFLIGDGSNLVDFTYVENVAYAHALAAVQLNEGSPVNGQAYFITNREPIFFWEFITRMHREWGYVLPWIPMPVKMMKPLAKFSEKMGNLLGPSFTTQAINYSGSAHYYSSEKAVRQMGYQPPIDMDEAMKRSLNYYWELRNKDPVKVQERKERNKKRQGKYTVATPTAATGFTSSAWMKAIVTITLLLLVLYSSKSWKLFTLLLSIVSYYLYTLYHTEFGAAAKMYTISAPPGSEQAKKIIMITGANRGIGFHTASEFLAKGYGRHAESGRIIITARDQTKGEEAVSALKQQYPGSNVEFYSLDLGSFASVSSCVSELKKNNVVIDILIHNAGAMTSASVTKDGFDSQFQGNFLSHVYLTNAMLKENVLAQAGRIVNVTSMMHYFTGVSFSTNWEDMQDLKQNRAGYSKLSMYCRSKLCQILYAAALQREFNKEANKVRLSGTTAAANVETGMNRRTVISVNPGAVATDFILHFLPSPVAQLVNPLLMCLVERTPQQGVQTVLYSAVSQELDNVGGVYVSNSEVVLPSKIARDEDTQEYIYAKAQEWCNSVKVQKK